MDDSQKPPETIARQEPGPDSSVPEDAELPESEAADSEAPSTGLAQIYDSGEPPSVTSDGSDDEADDEDDGEE